MDLKAKIGQRIMSGFPGPEMNEEFINLVKEYKVSNVILFKHNIVNKKQLKKLCADIQALVKAETGHPALIGIDQEGGVITRLPSDCVNVPGAMAIAATGDPGYATKAAEITGRELRALGIQIDYAPVADVNNNPLNPIIGSRSFGDTPEQVSRYCLATLKGFNNTGIIATAKHFPGHGDTANDSHVSLPMIDKSLDELYEMELVPFKALIEENIPSIMTTHILFPQIEKEKVPATMSRRIITGLLKEELGFKGLITSDCMEMGAIAEYYGTAKGVAAAMAAGVDMVMISHTVYKAVEAIKEVEKAIADGRISMNEMDESVDKILMYKKQYCLEPEGEAGTKEAFEVSEEIRNKTITLVSGKIPPLGDKPVFVGCADYRSGMVSNVEINDTTSAGFMAGRIGGDSYVTTKDPTDEEIAKVADYVKGHTSIIVNTYNGHLYDGQMKLVKAMSDMNIPMILIALRNPYDLKDLPSHVAGIAAWDYSNETLAALVPFVTGKVKPTGKMPIAL